MNKIVFALALATSFAAFAQAPAPVTVQGAWARAVLQGQSSSGGYMTLVASEPLTLTGASSPAAGIVEIHEMRMEGDVMRMRAVDRLELPAGKAVELKPGGYHLMLMNLKAPFRGDMRVPVTLQFRDAKGQQRTLEVALPVAHAAPHGAAHGAGHGR
jgi:hypothetical protein